VWAQLITFTELSALVVAVELIVTVFKLRASGMSLNRIPLYVWSIVVTSFMIIFAMPTVALASMCLILDRLVGTQFFNQAEGGDALMVHSTTGSQRSPGGCSARGWAAGTSG
jgi:cytochrome c oxidase subunit 1